MTTEEFNQIRKEEKAQTREELWLKIIAEFLAEIRDNTKK